MEFKSILGIIVAALVASTPGCAYYSTLPAPAVAGEQRPAISQHVLVNNTGAFLDVVVDGQTYKQRLASGQTVIVPYRVFYGKTVVTVLAHDADGNYLGTDSYVFLSSTPEVWTVHEFYRPNPNRR